MRFNLGKIIERNKARKILLAVTIVILPLLIMIGNIIGKRGLMINIAVPIAISSISYLWILYYLYLRNNANK